MARKAESTEKARGVFERPPGSGVWWIQFFDGKKRYREKVGTYRQAVKAYEHRKAEQRLKKFQPESVGRQARKDELPLSEAFATYIKDVEGTVSDTHLRDQRAYAKVWVELLLGKSLVEVDVGILAAAVQDLRKRTVAPTKCSTCTSPFRQEVERRLVAGESFRSVAQWLDSVGEVGNHTSLSMHKKQHMGATQRVGRRLSTATVNRYLACLQALFTWGINSGACEVNPVSLWKRTQKKGKQLVENNQRVRILTQNELASILQHLPEKYWPALLVALGTGLRLSEQLNLRWRDIHFETGFIHVGENRTRKQVAGRKTKSGKDRKVPLLPDVASLLLSLPSRGESEYVFPAARGEGPMGRHGGLRQAFDKALKASGVEDFTWHDCRHTFASNLAMEGVPIYDIKAILGHGSTVMTERYSHLSPDHLAEAVKGGSARFSQFTATCSATAKSRELQTSVE